MTASDEAKKVLEGVPALLVQIEALRARAEAAELREKSLLECNEINRKTLTKYNAEHAAKIAAKDAEIARMKDALKPFADRADRYDPPEHDDEDVDWDTSAPRLRVKHLRAAREVLKGDTRE